MDFYNDLVGYWYGNARIQKKKLSPNESIKKEEEMKEIFIGNYGLEQVGQTMTAQGWVANIRNHGKLAFIELRDREG